MRGVYRWLSTVGKECLVLPVGAPFEYNHGRSETTLVLCLVLHSEHDPATVGSLIKFAVCNLKQIA